MQSEVLYRNVMQCGSMQSHSSELTQLIKIALVIAEHNQVSSQRKWSGVWYSVISIQMERVITLTKYQELEQLEYQ